MFSPRGELPPILANSVLAIELLPSDIGDVAGVSIVSYGVKRPDESGVLNTLTSSCWCLSVPSFDLEDNAGMSREGDSDTSLLEANSTIASKISGSV